jgi:hypothetical protein
LHNNPTVPIQSRVESHLDDIFYVEDIGEVNGIQVPFTIGIHALAQFQIVLQFGYNGAISMYVTFGTNYVKYHLVTLMTPLHAKLVLLNMLN